MDSLGNRIARARKALGMSQAALARAAGVSQPVIFELERGLQRTTKMLPQIARALGLAPGDLDPAYGEPSGAPLLPIPTTDVIERLRTEPVFGARDLPVYAAVEGGPGEMVVSTDPIEWVPRPWYLKEVKEGYAVLVTGESMVPAYEPGDYVVVNPKLPAIPGKDAIFTMDRDDGEFRATIKRMIGRTDKVWKVRQFNPPTSGKAEFELPRDQWTKAVRVVGKFSGG